MTPVGTCDAVDTCHVSDVTRSGQVLMWQPQGVGDFADLAWVVAEALGNAAGVCGLAVSRSEVDGQLYAEVSCTRPGYVRDVTARLGGQLFERDGFIYSLAAVGDLLVSATWLAPVDAEPRS